MRQNWILEVLGDLHGFAASNDLPELAAQLEETIAVAATELAQRPQDGDTGLDGAETGRRTGTAG